MVWSVKEYVRYHRKLNPKKKYERLLKLKRKVEMLLLVGTTLDNPTPTTRTHTH